ncbi:MAG: alpha/beta fold hydrolase [Cytophagales bacterium]|nr:alpha/beta fold hydrolase [Cytophagales bacterium]
MSLASLAFPFTRLAAAFDPRINERSPSPLLFFLEGRAIFEWMGKVLTMPILSRRLPRGDGHPVLVLPGFMATDASTIVLRRFLSKQGYHAYGWGQGRNEGPRPGVFETLHGQLEQLYEKHGQKVSVIGWSLGGVFARELAREASDKVRQVITLGSPLYGEPTKTTNVWRLYKFVSGRQKVEPRERGNCQPPVPTTSIYTRGDGVVGWGCCVEKAGPMADNIEINAASHMGMGVNPLVLYAIGDRLALPENKWSHFKPEGLMRALFPFRAASR